MASDSSVAGAAVDEVLAIDGRDEDIDSHAADTSPEMSVFIDCSMKHLT